MVRTTRDRPMEFMAQRRISRKVVMLPDGEVRSDGKISDETSGSGRPRVRGTHNGSARALQGE